MKYLSYLLIDLRVGAGLWEYYAATIDAGIPDKFAKGDLVKWGKHFDYNLCTGDNKWTGLGLVRLGLGLGLGLG